MNKSIISRKLSDIIVKLQLTTVKSPILFHRFELLEILRSISARIFSVFLKIISESKFKHHEKIFYLKNKYEIVCKF